MEPRVSTPWRQNGEADPANNPTKATNGPYSRFIKTTEAYAHALYSDVVESREAEAFLKEDNQYDDTERKWSFSAMSDTTEQLVGSVYNVLRSIVGRFVRSEQDGVVREVENTFHAPSCEEKNEDGVRVSPVLLVRASGPSFQIPEALVSKTRDFLCLGFSNMATYFTVRLMSDVGTEKEIVNEMSSYARRIFREQPNRIFVRSLFITESHVRLVHFDRAGSQITPPIDIHQHPATLIRLVTGLSSTNERLVGLDNSVQWKVVDGRKTEGSLTTFGPTGERTTYSMLGQIATNRDTIRGRATTCWKVRDPVTSKEYVVKDSWRPDDRTPEHEFLESVKGIPGIVQMISCESARGETKDFRCPSTSGQYPNRVFERVMMELYGKPLMCFASVLQLIHALRDAIAAHHKLVGGDLVTLHRDISHNNVLIGKEGALEGERGVIIDFDMAFRATDGVPKVTVDHNIGTLLFQSIYVVGSFFPWEQRPAYDYLDDLESFLYLLTYVLLLCKPDGTRFPSNALGPSIVRTWGDGDTESIHTNKCLLFGAGAVADSALRFIEEHWGLAFGTLFDNFSWWILARRDDKCQLLIGPDATGLPDALDPLLARRDEHYAEVLAMFDEAIKAIKDSDSHDSGSPPLPTREGEDEDEDGDGNSTEGKVGPLPLQEGFHCAPVPQSVSPAAAFIPAAVPSPTDELPQDVEIQPSSTERTFKNLSPPRVDPAISLPRRSARIRNLQLANRSPSSDRIPPAAPAPVAPSLVPQPRRSDRIRKRRLEDDGPPEVALTGARPIKKRARVTTRRR